MTSTAINFVVLGTRNAGKTVYLSTLLGKGGDDEPGPRVAPSGQATVDYLKPIWTDLTTGAVPHATAAALRSLAFRYSDGARVARFGIEDYDGHFFETLSTEGEVSDRAELARRVMCSSGLIILFPFEPALDRETLDNLGVEVGHMVELVAAARPAEGLSRIPVVVGVTKWDVSEQYGTADENEAARSYAEAQPVYRDALARLAMFFETVTVVPLSSVGATYRFGVGGSINPRNLVRPFTILLEQVFRRIEQKAEALRDDPEATVAYLGRIHSDLSTWHHDGLLAQYQDAAPAAADGVLADLAAAPDAIGFQTVRVSLTPVIEGLSHMHTRDVTGEVDALETRWRTTTTRAARLRRRRRMASLLMAACLFAMVGYSTHVWTVIKEERQLREDVRQASQAESFASVKRAEASWEARMSDETFLIRVIPFLGWEARRAEVHEHVRLAANREAEAIAAEAKTAIASAPAADPAQLGLELDALEKRRGNLPDVDIPVVDGPMRALKMAVQTARRTADWISAAKAALTFDEPAARLRTLLDDTPQPAVDPAVAQLIRELNERADRLEKKGRLELALKTIAQAREPGEVVKFMTNDFSAAGLNDLERAEMSKAIDVRFERFEEKVLNDMPTAIDTSKDYRQLEDKLDSLRAVAQVFPSIDHRYVRSPSLSQRIAERRRELERAQQVFADGVALKRIVLIALRDKAPPFDIECRLFRSNVVADFAVVAPEQLVLPGKQASCKEGIDGNDKARRLEWNLVAPERPVNFHARPLAYQVRIAREDNTSEKEEFELKLDMNSVLKLARGEPVTYVPIRTKLEDAYAVRLVP